MPTQRFRTDPPPGSPHRQQKPRRTDPPGAPRTVNESPLAPTRRQAPAPAAPLLRARRFLRVGPEEPDL